jgi:hypothetical protein
MLEWNYRIGAFSVGQNETNQQQMQEFIHWHYRIGDFFAGFLGQNINFGFNVA